MNSYNLIYICEVAVKKKKKKHFRVLVKVRFAFYVTIFGGQGCRRLYSYLKVGRQLIIISNYCLSSIPLRSASVV